MFGFSINERMFFVKCFSQISQKNPNKQGAAGLKAGAVLRKFDKAIYMFL